VLERNPFKWSQSAGGEVVLAFLGLEEIGAAVEDGEEGGNGSHGELPERGLELRIGLLDLG
jgi:hypothetical protein